MWTQTQHNINVRFVHLFKAFESSNMTSEENVSDQESDFAGFSDGDTNIWNGYDGEDEVDWILKHDPNYLNDKRNIIEIYFVFAHWSNITKYFSLGAASLDFVIVPEGEESGEEDDTDEADEVDCLFSVLFATYITITSQFAIVYDIL